MALKLADADGIGQGQQSFCHKKAQNLFGGQAKGYRAPIGALRGSSAAEFCDFLWLKLP